mmetsp:Transcript_52216/g.148859  ORF Transcript_52216/g.148859 Transcript_52216/m.148859 type:complete len:268 (+) Transcript_52216:785-1588(+)
MLCLLKLFFHSLFFAFPLLPFHLHPSEFLLLLHGFFHDLRANKHLLLHGLELLHHLGMRSLLILLLAPSLLQLLEELLLFLHCHVLLRDDGRLLCGHRGLLLRSLLLEAVLDGGHVGLRDPGADDLLLLHDFLDDLLFLDDLVLHDDLLLLRLLRLLRLLGLLWLGLSSPPGLQLHLEACDLILKLPDHRVLGVLVDLGLVLDALRSICIPEGAQRLIVVEVNGPDASAHHRLGVSAQRVLQKPCKLGVSVWDERGLGVYQRRDYIA